MFFTDDVTTTNASNSAVDPADSSQKTPLSVLDDILNESEQEMSDEAAAQAAAAQAAAAAEAAKQSEQAAKVAAYEQAMAEQRAKDQQRIQQQLEELKTIETTPENQARLQQIEESKQQKTQSVLDSEGYDIKQLDHAKIPITE